MACAAAAYGFICRSIDFADCVAGGGVNHTFGVLEHCLHTPEAPTCQNDTLRHFRRGGSISLGSHASTDGDSNQSDEAECVPQHKISLSLE